MFASRSWLVSDLSHHHVSDSTREDLLAAMTNIEAVGDGPDGFAIIVDDGCDLPAKEVLGLLRLGISGSVFPVDGNAPVPSDRALLLLTIGPPPAT